jgi:L-iditol 2-dehydrogenase
MKALVYTAPHQLEFREVAGPSATGEEALVKIEASGICGSDMHAFLGHDERRPPPLILGHEAAGVVAAGSDAGKRVVINPLVTCGHCHACKQNRSNLCEERQIISMPPRAGAFAQYVAMPKENLVTIPDEVDCDRAALTEPLACGWHAVRIARSQMFDPLQSGRTLILGGGAIGVGAALALRAHGVTDIWISEGNEARRKSIASIGDFATFDPHSTGWPDKASFDLVIDAVGLAATRAAACSSIRPGGVIVHIGLGENTDGLDVRRMTLQEITFVGTYTYTTDDFRQTAKAIFDGRMGALDWMDIRPLSDGARAFDDIRNGRVAAPKIILKP